MKPAGIIIFKNESGNRQQKKWSVSRLAYVFMKSADEPLPTAFIEGKAIGKFWGRR